MFNKFMASLLPWFPRRLTWAFSRRYIAGSTRTDALALAREWNGKGAAVTLDLLGEVVTDPAKAGEYQAEYQELIEQAAAAQVDTSFSVKPTMFGLKVDRERCLEILRDLCGRAAATGRFLRLDMEDSSCTSDEIDFFVQLRREFGDQVGIVLQAYLKRTGDDLRRLAEVNDQARPVKVRLCKGIYLEPAEIAYRKREEIHRRFLDHLEFLFAQRFHTAIATHHDELVEGAVGLLAQHGVERDLYEFQFLHGVRPQLVEEILGQGHPVRIYIPYGAEWLEYSLRRLQENPQILGHVLRSIFLGRG